MPSPHQKPMRPPGINGPVPIQPGQQQAGNPMMRAGTPQQQMGQQQFAHPQQPGGPGGPTVQSPAPMTPQHQQMLHAQAAQAQAMQQRAQQTLMQVQAQHQYAQPGQPAQLGPGQPGAPGQPGQPGHPQQGQPGQPIQQGGPQGMMSREQLQLMQHQQMQAAANHMYSSLGLGQINPQVMHSSAAALGLQGRDVGAMSDEDRVS